MQNEVKDWASLLPLQPSDEVLEWLQSKGELKANLLIYRCDWILDPLTNKKRNMVKVKCTACGEEWYEYKITRETCARYGGDSIGYYDHATNEDIYHKQSAICPWCGATGEAWHVTHMSKTGFEYDNCTVMTVELIEDRLVPIIWDYYLVFFNNGDKRIFSRRLEAYIPDGKKCIRCAGFFKYFRTVTMLPNWEQKKKFDVQVSQPQYIFPFSKKTVEESTTPNCKLDQYSKCKGCQIANYLNLYVKKPNVENLVVQGLGSFLSDCFTSNYYEPRKYIPDGFLNLKAAKPREILGLTKEEYNVFRRDKWTVSQLKWYRENRYLVNVEDTKELFKWTTHDIDRLLKHQNYMRLFRYINKQKEMQQNVFVDIGYYTDYIDMAKKNGEDITDPRVRFPQKLVSAHDYQMLRMKFKEKEELKTKFKERFTFLKKYGYTDEELGLVIFPCKEEQELHREGKFLSHCVARYADEHANGKTNIFFIRHTDNPLVPYFTLELSEPERQKGNVKVLQNRGKFNCQRTPEVIEFENKWTEYLKNILKKEHKENERSDKNEPA
jgi:hypothetical protein